MQALVKGKERVPRRTRSRANELRHLKQEMDCASSYAQWDKRTGAR